MLVVEEALVSDVSEIRRTQWGSTSSCSVLTFARPGRTPRSPALDHHLGDLLSGSYRAHRVRFVDEML